MVARLSNGGGTPARRVEESSAASSTPAHTTPAVHPASQISPGSTPELRTTSMYSLAADGGVPRGDADLEILQGLDISTFDNLKHAFEIVVHSYKLQKEALEANRRRWVCAEIVEVHSIMGGLCGVAGDAEREEAGQGE
jgi:hypothetical protein